MSLALTISISRTSLSLPALVFSGIRDSTVLGVVGYQEPARQWQREYMPDSVDSHGSELIAAKYQQAILGWDWCREDSTEAQVKASVAEVLAALGQFSYTITTQANGAAAEVWSADPGDQVPTKRDYSNMVRPGTLVYAVSVPVYPVAS